MWAVWLLMSIEQLNMEEYLSTRQRLTVQMERFVSENDFSIFLFYREFIYLVTSSLRMQSHGVYNYSSRR